MTDAPDLLLRAPVRGAATAATDGRSEIVLDISRLLARIRRPAPTGIDRVEMAYATHLLERRAHGLSFAAVHPAGVYGRLDSGAVRRFLEATARSWEAGAPHRSWLATQAAALASLARLAPRPRLGAGDSARKISRVYLQASPHHLDRPRLVRSILRREAASFVCVAHDLIPIELPEYATPAGTQRHRRRVDVMAREADAIVAVSHATAQALIPHLRARGARASVTVAPLGVGGTALPCAPAPEPYFVMLGTIEPRKNHLMALSVWRALAAALGPERTPRLHVIGARGWENENVIDLLERSAALAPLVVEHPRLPDAEVRRLIRGARALIMPSFAEGFGLPVVEALRLGTPVICSDLPAHREAGGEAPEFLDPTDGPGWRAAVSDYADLLSPRRQAQMSRLARWRAPSWDEHMDIVLGVADALNR